MAKQKTSKPKRQAGKRAKRQNDSKRKAHLREIKHKNQIQKIIDEINRKHDSNINLPKEVRHQIQSEPSLSVVFALDPEIKNDVIAKDILSKIKENYPDTFFRTKEFDYIFSISDWFAAGYKTMYCMSDYIKDNEYLYPLITENNFPNSNQITNITVDCFDQLYLFMALIFYKYSDLSKGIYYSKKENSYEKNQIKMVIDKQEPVIKEISIDGKKRKAYKVGGYFGRGNQVVWLNIEPEKIGIKSEDPIPIYIQNHALLRLSERLGTLGHSYINIALIDSLMNISIRNKNENRFLIDFNSPEKLGYLTATIIDDVCLVTSFLFITMNGTPDKAMNFTEDIN